MKKQLFLLAVLLGLSTMVSHKMVAQEYKTGVGLRFAYYTPGLSINHFINPNTDIEGIISSKYGLDYILTGLYKKHKPLDWGIEELSWYYGGGAHLGSAVSLPIVGIDGVVGLEYVFKDIPVAVSLDASPFVDVLPEFRVSMDVGLGIHYIFK